jgi:hypothetical protein
LGGVSSELVVAHRAKIWHLLRRYLALGQRLFWTKHLSLEEFVKIYGVDVLFRESSPLMLDLTFAPTAYVLLRRLNDEDNSLRADTRALLISIGRIFQRLMPPWIHFRKRPQWMQVLSRRNRFVDLAGEELWGALCLACCVIEIGDENSLEVDGIEKRTEGATGTFSSILNLLAAQRTKGGLPEDNTARLLPMLKKWNLDEYQQISWPCGRTGSSR